MAEPLTLTVSLRGTREVKENYQLFRLTGLLDAFSEATFRRVISKCIEDGPKHIILDLSQIDFVDSSGLGALVQLVKKAQTDEGTLQIVTNPRVTQTVKLVRLEKFLSLQPSVDDALNNIKPPKSS
ncbi:STAS domain-containing protein [Microcoleus sp. FACHB-68]|nr:STAS domain-containing protein [Microcoleus sp. FACHB-68]